MTLLIGALANNTAFNVSDRLLTQQLRRGGTFVGTQTFDDVSNKSIVYMGGNGMFCMSFTGTAYINDIPTDRWVAEILSGMSLPEGSDYRHQNDIKKWKNTGMAMRAIIEELNRVWPTLPAAQQKGDIGFLVTGWQKVGKRWKTILWGIADSGITEKPFKLKSFPNVHTIREAITATAGASISSAEQKILKEKFLEEVRHGTSDSAQKTLAEELRTLAINRPTVGTDCMGVKMTWATTPYVTIEYIPDPNKATSSRTVPSALDNRCGMIIAVGDKDSFSNIPPDIESGGTFFCPWIITPDSVTPPSSIVGTQTIKQGEQEFIKIIGSTPSGNIIGGLVPQSRLKRP